MSDGIQSNLSNVLTDEELAEQRRLVQFYNYPWPIGPVIIERGEMSLDSDKQQYQQRRIDMTMPNDNEQRELLKSLKDGGGYGILAILQRPGHVLFAASPVPKLTGYEIVCATPERLYDIWKDGRLVTPSQTRQQIKDWIKQNTPAWLYDDSEVTDTQKKIVAAWVELFAERYPPASIQVVCP